MAESLTGVPPLRLHALSDIGDANALGHALYTQLVLAMGGLLDDPALVAAVDEYLDRRKAECLAMSSPEVNPAGLVVVNADALGNTIFGLTVAGPASRGERPAGPLELYEWVIDRMHRWQAANTDVHLHMGGAYYWIGLRDLVRDDLFGGLLYVSQAVKEDERSGGKRVTPASLFINLDATTKEQAGYVLVERYSAILDKYLDDYRSAGLGKLSNKAFRRRLRNRQAAGLVLFHAIAQLPYVADPMTQTARDHRFAGLAYSVPLLELCLIFEELLSPKAKGAKTLGRMIPKYTMSSFIKLKKSDVETSNREANKRYATLVTTLLDRQKLVGRRKPISAQERDVLLVHAIRNESAHRAARSMVLAQRFEDIAGHLLYATFHLVESS